MSLMPPATVLVGLKSPQTRRGMKAAAFLTLAALTFSAGLQASPRMDVESPHSPLDHTASVQNQHTDALSTFATTVQNAGTSYIEAYDTEAARRFVAPPQRDKATASTVSEKGGRSEVRDGGLSSVSHIDPMMAFVIANPEQEGPHAWLSAVQSFDAQAVSLLLTHKIPMVSQESPGSVVPLLQALEKARPAFMAEDSHRITYSTLLVSILKNGAAHDMLNTVMPGEYTALTFLLDKVKHGNLPEGPLYELIVEGVFDVNQPDGMGRSPLVTALGQNSSGEAPLVEALALTGANPNTIDRFTGETALTQIFKARPYQSGLLLDHLMVSSTKIPPDVNAPNAFGLTPAVVALSATADIVQEQLGTEEVYYWGGVRMSAPIEQTKEAHAWHQRSQAHGITQTGYALNLLAEAGADVTTPAARTAFKEAQSAFSGLKWQPTHTSLIEQAQASPEAVMQKGFDEALGAALDALSEGLAAAQQEQRESDMHQALFKDLVAGLKARAPNSSAPVQESENTSRHQSLHKFK